MSQARANPYARYQEIDRLAVDHAAIGSTVWPTPELMTPVQRFCAQIQLVENWNPGSVGSMALWGVRAPAWIRWVSTTWSGLMVWVRVLTSHR